MADNRLTVGTNTTPSAEFTVAEGKQMTLCLKGNSSDGSMPNAQIYIQIKDDASKFWTVDTLTFTSPACILSAAGVYRLVRKAGGKSAGVFSV